MTTLLLDHPDYQLTLQDGLLHLAHPELPSRLYSLGQISRLMVGQGITLSSDLLLKLAERGIDFIAMGRRSCTHLCSLHHAPDSLRLIQYRAITQPDCQQQLVRRLLNARRIGQNCVLAQLGEPPLPPLKPLHHPMLAEAELSQRYWQGSARQLAGTGFTGRQRQPPRDPVNALLSLTSTLEDSALLPPLLAEGFDPQLGLHHVTGYRRPSLLLDIKELTRAELERWLLQLWQSHTLRAEHFTTSDQGCRLTRAGQQLFYPLWFGWQKTRKPRLRQLTRVCRKVLEQTLKREGGHDH